MADKKQNRRNNKNYDDDYNPRFRKQRKKVCVTIFATQTNKLGLVNRLNNFIFF